MATRRPSTSAAGKRLRTQPASARKGGGGRDSAASSTKDRVSISEEPRKEQGRLFKTVRRIVQMSAVLRQLRKSLNELKIVEEDETKEDVAQFPNTDGVTTSSPKINVLPPTDDLTTDLGVDTKAAEAEQVLLLNPPKHLVLVMAAKRGDWLTFDRELNTAFGKKDSRIDTADPRTGETALMFACQSSRLLSVGSLCELGVAINMRAIDQRTALHYAAANNSEDIVKMLLKNRADPNLFGGADSQLPLHIALLRTPTINLTIVQYLLGACVKECRLMKDSRGNLPITYAFEAGLLAVVKEMLQFFPKEQVAWYNEQNGDRLVHIAARMKSVELMKALAVVGGAPLNVQNNVGHTPLHIIAKQGDEAMAKFLQPFKPDANIADKKERTALHLAAEHGHTVIVRMLITKYKGNVLLRTKDGSTLLHLAADRGHVATVVTLIKHGTPMIMPNKSGALCLHVAAQNGHVHVVKVLVKNDLPADARTKDNYTALHLAVINNKSDVILALLGLGAKVDLRGGPLKEAPLHIAARQQEGFQCAEHLIQSGARVNNATEETQETPLHIAAKTGTTDLVRLLLEEGADPMLLTKSGESALHYAVRYCWLDCAKAIVTFINDKNSTGREATNLVNLSNNEGESCFHLASELAKSQAHNPFEDVDIVRLLLDNGADPLSVTSLTNETSLHYCARSGNPDILNEIIRHLKGEFQVACNRQDRMGWSPLMTACSQGHIPIVRLLLTNGARVDVFDDSGKASIHLAAEGGHKECCEILLNHKAFVNAKSKLGVAPLHLAAQQGYTDLVGMLIKRYNATVNILSLDKETPLHQAADNGRKEVCDLLLRLRASAVALDSLGQMPIHQAAEHGHADVVRLFIKFQPNLSTVAATKTGNTCAHIAARNGCEDVIKLLMQVDKQLVTNMRNQLNEALPIHLAVTGSHEHVVKLLINAGASPVAENQEGMTAIHMAAKAGDMDVLQAIISSSPKEALRTNSLKNGLSPMHVAAFYGKAEIIRELQTLVDGNSRTDQPKMASVVTDPELKTLISIDHGLTALHMASVRGHANVVRLLLNSEVQTDVTSHHLARVPLHYACANGHHDVVSLLMSLSASHLSAQDKHGRCPLHLAAENGHVDMVSMLLRQGVEINSSDKDQWTPLHFATRNGQFNVVKLLIEAGASPTAKTSDGKVALVLSVNGGHFDIFLHLLKKEHDTNGLMNDKVFLMDLMLLSKATDEEAIDNFVMHSKAPLEAAVKLSRRYRELAAKEKERAKDLNDLSRRCEIMASDLLVISSSLTSPSAILQAMDDKGKQMLDVMLENTLKKVIENATVQRYLSDIWEGPLNKWPDFWLPLLFFLFLLFPPLMVYFCLPFKKRYPYHHIPAIKFMAMIVAHIYHIGALIIVAAVPYNPIVYRDDFLPSLSEYLLLAFEAGILVSELTKQTSPAGLGSLRYVMIFCSVVATLFQIAAIGVE